MSHLDTTNEKMVFDEAEYKRLHVTVTATRVILAIGYIATAGAALYVAGLLLMQLVGDGFNFVPFIVPLLFLALAIAMAVCGHVILKQALPRHTRLLRIKDSIHSLLRSLNFWGAEVTIGDHMEYGRLDRALLRATRRTDESWLLEMFRGESGVQPAFSAVIMDGRLQSAAETQDALLYSQHICDYLNAMKAVIRSEHELLQFTVNEQYQRDAKIIGDLLTDDEPHKSALDTFGVASK